MIQCPSCAGALRFDIPTQLMACDYCGNTYKPFDFDGQSRNAEEKSLFETTVFTCPQCGGEIYSTDEQAAGFCSFCGTPTVLESRLKQMKCPDYLIPFQITKDQCKKSYIDAVKKAIFAPKELCDPAHVEEFRGIYMPYWTYYVTQKGPIGFNGQREHREGNYIITDHYRITGDIDAYYKGISYDASSSFEDSISDVLAPYDVKGMKGFSPAYLSGFYADTADVKSSVYEQEALQMSFEESAAKLQKDQMFTRYDVELTGTQTPASLNTKVKETNYSLFPVWFLAYRNKDRVAYATINGQTGKVVADVPIDPKKYLIGSLLLAIPLFFLLELLFQLVPSKALSVVAIMSVITLFVYSHELKLIGERESREQDLGYMSKTDPENYQKIKRYKKTSKKIKTGKKFSVAKLIWIFVLIHIAACAIPFGIGIVEVLLEGGSGISFFAWLAIIACTIILDVNIFKRFEKTPGRRGIVGIIASLVSLAIGGIIRFINPVYDAYYFAAIILVIVGMWFTLIDIIRSYNLLSTRRLPQFNHEGGDDRA